MQAARLGNLRKVQQFLENDTFDRLYLSKCLSAASSNYHFLTAAALVRAGANIDVRNENGLTPLMLATFCNNVPFFNLVIKYGANVDATDCSGETPLIQSARGFHNNLATALLANGADVNATGEHGTALHVACQSGFKYCEHIFVQCGGNFVSTLIDHGADVNVRDAIGQSPLHLLASAWRLTSSVEERHRSLAAQLISCGANVNAMDSDGRTPLRLAIDNGYHNLASFLTKSGAMRDQS
ncbi:Ankyrin repeats (3 copies) [Stieleria neptunia]|uniref:Ankyrin repeats (3 copies) n=1 Tax=Stieleria neptunia TaxID=2527979 RepID=A0A518HJ93_9BACT|nr:ankyrin repeat domain-containing protein [Stieleria neptunia]QDV40879.1 Ankyrin repeats (3 copies) [Stieleria neptunia]